MKPMYQARKKIVAGRTKRLRATSSSRNSGDCSIASQSMRGSVCDMAVPPVALDLCHSAPTPRHPAVCEAGRGPEPPQTLGQPRADKLAPVLEPLRTVTATRYAEALREGGSLPGLLEADDDGMYVTKFRGAGQGEK